MVDYSGLENRRAERHRGFESLSLRNKGVNQQVMRFAPFITPQKTMLPKIYSPRVLDMEFSVCSMLNLLMNPFLLLSMNVTSNSKHLSVRLCKCIYLVLSSYSPCNILLPPHFFKYTCHFLIDLL